MRKSNLFVDKFWKAYETFVGLEAHKLWSLEMQICVDNIDKDCTGET